MSRFNSNHHRFVDITGQSFGQLTALEVAGKSRGGAYLWACACSCGARCVVNGANLRNGHTVSCGCAGAENHLIHGLSNTPEYRSWNAMWDRCTNPNNVGYKVYKSRRPPDEWNVFEAFYAELGPRPSGTHTLERIDNSLPYGPGNCKWATPAEQSRNRATNIYVEYRGQELCLLDACASAGQNYKNLWARFRRSGNMQTASEGLFDLA